MDKLTIDGPKMPIGLMASLWKGIEYVNAHLGILVLPVLMDVFLWFGPRLSIVTIAQPLFEWMASKTPADPQAQASVNALIAAIKDFNLFNLLSLIPLYPPSIMADITPTASPLGTPVVFTIPGWTQFLLLTTGIGLFSMVFGSAYWMTAGWSLKIGAGSFREGVVRWIRTVAVVVVLCAAFLFTVIAVGGPLLLFLQEVPGISADIKAGIAQVIIILGGSLLFWLVLFVMFSVHGTILFGDGVRSAIWNSVNTSRWLYPVSVWIPILLIMLNLLLSMVWSLAPADNWTGAIGVLGNAYTGSVIVTASMVYYIDKRRWVSEVKQYLQSRMAGSMPPPAA